MQRMTLGSATRLILAALVCGAAQAIENPEERSLAAPPLVRIRYAAESGPLHFQTTAPGQLESQGKFTPLPPGSWTVKAQVLKPALQCHHVFSKTFPPEASEAMAAYLKEWRAQGYPAEAVAFGKTFQCADGRKIDNRIFWVSLDRFATQPEAQALVERLKHQQVWAWIRAETQSPGYGVLSFYAAEGPLVTKLPAPVLLTSPAAITLRQVDIGYLSEKRRDLDCPGALQLRLGPNQTLETLGTMALEEYLRGVLPAEMAAAWPPEALKAQAVCARSEVLAALQGKHHLEGFDACACEHCRAWTGVNGYAPTTDAALEATAGEILLQEGRIVETVFSACCGGWTENNENVWAGPPKAALRGAPCLPEGTLWASKGINEDTVAIWLRESPEAYCREDKKHFRWERRLSLQEASRLINRYHRIGALKTVKMGERGVSGRLKRVTVIGDQGSAVIEKELAIRKAFGALPSAMCIIRIERDEAGKSEVCIRGGGRGHGVGLCQYGARGMALQGMGYRGILDRYFSQTELIRFP